MKDSEADKIISDLVGCYPKAHFIFDASASPPEGYLDYLKYETDMSDFGISDEELEGKT